MTQRTDWGAWNIKIMENNIMDYEKAYKEAFERAKNYHDNNFSFGTTQLTEAIFPELKESENERIRKAISAAICGTTAETVLEANGAKLVDALSYLEKQKEQKPAEWSKEDQKMIDLIIAIFKVNHPNGYFKANELDGLDMRGVCTEEIVSWLKSLRPKPHWKPSDEQMKALLSKLSVVKGSGDKVQDILESLYSDLKKL